MQIVDYVLNQNLGGRGARRDRDGGNPDQPRRIDGLRVINEIADGAQVARHFDQPVGVGTVGGTDHQHQPCICLLYTSRCV